MKIEDLEHGNFTDYELEVIRAVAQRRLSTALGNPRFQYTPGRDGALTHTIGAAAELTAAQALGAYWTMASGVYTRVPDVILMKTPVEVRWNNGCRAVGGGPALKSKPNDHPESVLVLVTGWPAMQVRGWAHRDAVRERGVFEDDPPCWWLEAGKLNSVQSLLDYAAMRVGS